MTHYKLVILILALQYFFICMSSYSQEYNEDELRKCIADYNLKAGEELALLLVYHENEDTLRTYYVTASISFYTMLIDPPDSLIEIESQLVYIYNLNRTRKDCSKQEFIEMYKKTTQYIPVDIDTISWDDYTFQINENYEPKNFDPFIFSYSFVKGKLIDIKDADYKYEIRYVPKFIDNPPDARSLFE